MPLIIAPPPKKPLLVVLSTLCAGLLSLGLLSARPAAARSDTEPSIWFEVQTADDAALGAVYGGLVASLPEPLRIPLPLGTVLEAGGAYAVSVMAPAGSYVYAVVGVEDSAARPVVPNSTLEARLPRAD